MAKTSIKTKKKGKKQIPELGRAYVTATFNNTVVTFTDETGQVLSWGSAGTVGFKGTRKSTPFAATTAVREVAEKMRQAGLKRVDIFIKGAGLGREAAVRALKAAGFQIRSLADISPIPHNGCRPKKRRRV